MALIAGHVALIPASLHTQLSGRRSRAGAAVADVRARGALGHRNRHEAARRRARRGAAARLLRSSASTRPPGSSAPAASTSARAGEAPASRSSRRRSTAWSWSSTGAARLGPSLDCNSRRPRSARRGPMPEPLVLERGPVRVTVGLDPLAIEIRRGRRLIRELRLWAAGGEARDQFVQLTEGVLAAEELERAAPFERGARRRPARLEPATLGDASHRARGRARRHRVRARRRRPSASAPSGRRAPASASPASAPATASSSTRPAGASGSAPTVATPVPTARPTCSTSAASRRATTPPSPGCSPAAATPSGSRPTATASSSTSATGSRSPRAPPPGRFRLHVLTDPTPAARLRRFLRLTGLPALLPEWAYGHWKSRDVYEHQRDVEDDFDGYRAPPARRSTRSCIDSPWETQYNTWEPNPHQFADFEGMVAPLPRRRRAHGRLGHALGEPRVGATASARPTPSPSACTASPPPTTRPRRAAGPLRQDGGRRAVRRALVDGHRLAGRLHLARGRGVVARAGKARAADSASRASRPTTARATTSRRTCASPTAAAAPRPPGRYGLLYRRSMQRALDEVHPGRGVLFGRSGWTGQQALGVTWGGDQASDFWSLETLVTATLTAAASGFSNWSHDVGGYLGERLVARCPKELLLRWVQFGCFTPLMQAHGRFPQEAWTYDAETLRDLPRARAAARAPRAVRARRGGHRGPHRAADRPAAAPRRPRRRARLDARRPVRLRPGALGRARCSSTGRASARCRCRAATGSTSGPASASRRRRAPRAGAARPHPGLRPQRLDPRDLSRRARGRRPRRHARSASARSRRPSGASRRSGAPPSGSPTGPASAGSAGAGPRGPEREISVASARSSARASRSPDRRPRRAPRARPEPTGS